MPDYYPVIARAVSRLGNNSSEARQALYGQARAFLDSKLSGRVPPFAESDKNRARSTLEAAISRVDAEWSSRTNAPKPEATNKEAADEAFLRLPFEGRTIALSCEGIRELYGDKRPNPDDGLLGWIPDLEQRLRAAEEAGEYEYIEVPLKDWLAKTPQEVANKLHDHLRIRPPHPMEIRVHIERSDESQSLVDTGEVGRGPKIDLTKSNIVEALEAGLVLVEPNFATSDEISWVDELIKGGVASGCWTFEDAESTRMVRLVRGVGSRRNRSSAKELLSTFRGRWYLEASSEPLNILSIVWKEGLRTGYAAFALRQQASKLNAYPTPLSPEFLHDLATNLGRWGKTWSYKKANFDSSAQQSVQRALFRISNPDTPVDRFNHIVDSLLAWYGLAPLPSVVGEEHWSAYLRR